MRSKEEILRTSLYAFTSLTEFCKTIPPEKFFDHPPGKWSVAENIRHLIISTNTTTLAFRTPGFFLNWWAGIPNRPSRSYDELVARYRVKLKEGGRATGRFVPGNISASSSAQEWLEKWASATNKYINAVDKNYKDPSLDKYLVKHPLLGRITLRELCYFTLYHCIHHHNIIRERLSL